MGRGNRFYLHLLVPGYNITNESHYEVVVSRIFLAFFFFGWKFWFKNSRKSQVKCSHKKFCSNSIKGHLGMKKSKKKKKKAEEQVLFSAHYQKGCLQRVSPGQNRAGLLVSLRGGTSKLCHLGCRMNISPGCMWKGTECQHQAGKTSLQKVWRWFPNAAPSTQLWNLTGQHWACCTLSICWNHALQGWPINLVGLAVSGVAREQVLIPNTFGGNG